MLRRCAPGLVARSSGQLLVLAATLCTVPRGASAELSRFLIISAPRTAKISYVTLPEDGSYANMKPKVLIDTGLRHPQGIAVDRRRQRLYVADPDVQKIYAYQLISKGDGTLHTDGRQSVISQNTESRWVSVDGLGNIFFSDEPQNQILKVTADKALRSDPTPEVVYSGSNLQEVSRPGGIVADGFHIFWTNKHYGTQVGSVIKGSEHPSSESSPHSLAVLARNTQKSYGICTALGNIFFTDSEKRLYGMKKTGGPIAEVSGSLTRPRGCVWDGDGTVFVADRGDNAVYAFPGNMHVIGHSELQKVIEFEDAFGLALMSTASRSLAMLQPLCFIAMLMSAWWV